MRSPFLGRRVTLGSSSLAICIVATDLEERADQILPPNLPAAAFILASTV